MVMDGAATNPRPHPSPSIDNNWGESAEQPHLHPVTCRKTRPRLKSQTVLDHPQHLAQIALPEEVQVVEQVVEIVDRETLPPAR